MKKLLLLLLLLLPLLSFSQKYEYNIISYRVDSTYVDSVFITTTDSVWYGKNGMATIHIKNGVVSFDFPWLEYYDYNVLNIEESKYGVNFDVIDAYSYRQKIEVIEYDGYTFFTLIINGNYITFVSVKKEKS